VTLAHLHAMAFAVIASWVVVFVIGPDLGRASFRTNPVLATLATTFVAFSILNVWIASRREARSSLTEGARRSLKLSGGIVSFLGIPLLEVAAENVRF
jgi:hypothetical protein